MRQTLPTWSRGWPWSLDVVRKVVRRRPELQALGELVGPTKVYTAEEAEQIRLAVESRSAPKGRAVAV